MLGGNDGNTKHLIGSQMAYAPFERKVEKKKKDKNNFACLHILRHSTKAW